MNRFKGPSRILGWSNWVLEVLGGHRKAPCESWSLNSDPYEF